MDSRAETEAVADGKGRHQVINWVVVIGLAMVLVAVSFWVGLRLAGPTVNETEIGRVSLEVKPEPGSGVTAFIPVADWGLKVEAFHSLFGLDAELRSLNRDSLGQIASGDRDIVDTISDQLSSAATRTIIRGLAIGFGVTLVILLIATLLISGLQPRWGLLVSGAAISVLLIVLSLGAARVTFDRAAFSSPTYFASGDEISRILEVAQDPRARTRFGAEFGSILRGISIVLSRDTPDAEPYRTMFLASDFHGNALVVDPVSEIVGDTPLFLVGDLGQRSLGPEIGLIAPRVAALGSRVLAVSGNHDSASLMRRLVTEGVTVLGREGKLESSGQYVGKPIAEVDGLSVAGYPDPLEWQEPLDSPDRPITFKDFNDTDAARAAALAEVIAWFDTLDPTPDVVMIHQNELAAGLAEELFERGYDRDLTILTGHNHRQQVDRYGNVVVVNAGSVGASGVFGVGRDSAGIARLNFDMVLPRLDAVDLLSIEPVSGQAQATRIVISAMCPGEDRCTATPAGAVIVTPEENPQ